MTRNERNDRINDLLERERWSKARKLLEKERDRTPEDHWVLTQLGVTYYEQRRYKKALQLFLASRKILPDCPLTRWNLAGALDALGKHTKAVEIYTGLLKSSTSAKEDPCWESKEWSDVLKADCVYRLGVSFEHLGRGRRAEQCYRQYLNLLLAGIEGTYSIEEVTCKIRAVHGGKNGALGGELQTAIAATLQVAGSGSKTK